MTEPVAHVDFRCARCGILVRVWDLNGAVDAGARFVCGACMISVKASA